MRVRQGKRRSNWNTVFVYFSTIEHYVMCFCDKRDGCNVNGIHNGTMCVVYVRTAL